MRNKNVAYITKNSSREDIYDAYIKSQKLLKEDRSRLKECQARVKQIRVDKNKRYNELRYALLKKEQRIYTMQKHIFNLQRFAVSERSKAKKTGIEIGKGKVKKIDYSVIKMYEFLLQIDQVSNILNLKLSYCAFILWAGKYSFFNFKDFNNDITNSKHKFHYFINKFMKTGHIIPIYTDNVKKQYALTGTGIDLFNKIDSFTKKHFNE
jgi:hypothetical protein